MCLIRAFAAIDSYLRRFRPDRGIIVRKYLLGEYSEYDEDMTHVPEDCIYVEEWRKGDEIRRRLVYELEEIKPFDGDPFQEYKLPWAWLGDVTTDVDITMAVDKYLMVGNEIRLDLLLLFLNPHPDMEIRYTHPASGQHLLFPNKGVRIVADGPA